MPTSVSPPETEALRLPLDRRGWFRRECTRCHRQFKLQWAERDARDVHRAVHRLLAHGNSHEVRRELLPRSCPYCSFVADAEEWCTEEQRVLLRRRAAALGEVIRYEQLRLVERTLDQNPFPTFLVIPPKPFTYQPRAEPDDMRVVPLVCCGEEVKIRESWESDVCCPYCGVQHFGAGS